MHAIILAAVLVFAADAHPSSPLADQHIAVSAETFAGLPRVTVKAKEHEQPEATYEGVSLGSILERAGVPRGEKLRGAALRNVVVITASDGYRVVYALPETDGAFTD